MLRYTTRRIRSLPSYYKANISSVTILNTKADMATKTPVYFISHGGPNIMFDNDHKAYAELQRIGREITQEVRPKAIVVFSAHWLGEPSLIEVNTSEAAPLIYDYYGFSPEYYKVQYPNVGAPKLAERVIELLAAQGIKAEGRRRGLDHGVFAGFRVAFDPDKNPLNVPIVQVSLFDSDDPDQHYRLGAAVQSLRDEGVVIICSGMSVHNLRDMFRPSAGSGTRPYVKSFEQALKEAVEQPSETRQKAMAELLKRSDARQAHPGFDHILPIHVAAGAAGNDPGRRTWTMPEKSVAWAQFKFQEVAT